MKSRSEFFLGKPKDAEYFGKQAYEISKELKDSVFMTKSLVVLGILREEENDSEMRLTTTAKQRGHRATSSY